MAHLTIIVTASNAPVAKALCSALAGTAGAGMFVVGLSASGLFPATHFVSSGVLENAFVAPLTDSQALYTACQGVGSSLTHPQCVALLNASDVSTDEGQVAISRLGLKLCQSLS